MKTNNTTIVYRTRGVPIRKGENLLLKVSRDAKEQMKKLNEQHPNVKKIDRLLCLPSGKLVRIQPDGSFSQDIISEEEQQSLKEKMQRAMTAAKREKAPQTTLDQEI